MSSVINDITMKRIVVIGAGPAGLAAAKYLLAERAFSDVIIFEQRLAVGGVWIATPSDIGGDRSTIPQTMPSIVPDDPIWRADWKGAGAKFRFISAIYDDLETNIPHNLMNYSDLAFPEGTPLFPPHEEVLQYLERYSRDVIHLVQFGTQVLKVRDLNGEGWSVTTRNLNTSLDSTSRFDAVIVASGHYDDCYIPDIPGLKEWNFAYPGSISHSKFYRRPDTYRGKKVLIVGNSASGIDIASQIVPRCATPLLISSRSPSPADFPKPSGLITEVPEIKEFLVSDHAIRFINDHIEKDIEVIIFCTGYMYSFPFLTTAIPPLVTDGSRTRNLYQQIFYYYNPTLSFVALPQRVHPFPISESQSAIISRFLAGRLSLPSLAAMREWEDDLIRRKGDGKQYHIFGFPHDAEYINGLHDWAMSAANKPGLENNGDGKIPPYWGESEKWLRERTPAIKSRYRALGLDRKKVRRVEELGFHHEKATEKKAEIGGEKITNEVGEKGPIRPA